MNIDLGDSLLRTWRTSDRVTRFLIESIPDSLWAARIPGTPRKTVRMLSGHLHNTRCMWLKTVGRRQGVSIPASVDRNQATQHEVLRALGESRERVADLIRIGLKQGGRLPGFPPDLVHFVTYLITHEGHHRGQIVLAARQLGQPLPPEAVYGLWMWSKRAREASSLPG